MQLTELINPTRSSLPSISTTSSYQKATLNLPTYTSIYAKQSLPQQSQQIQQKQQQQLIIEPLKKISLPPISDILAQQQAQQQQQQQQQQKQELPSVNHLQNQSSPQPSYQPKSLPSIQPQSSTPSSTTSQQSYFNFNVPGNRSPNSNNYTTTTTTTTITPNISSPSAQIPYYTQQHSPQYHQPPPPPPQYQLQHNHHQYQSQQQYSPQPHLSLHQPQIIRSNSYPIERSHSQISSSSLKDNNKRKTRNNLPKEITYILLRWLNDHLNHPYPNSFEKNQLMLSTGLNQQQLSNWFINARRRKIKSLKEQKRMNLI
ncbi:CUP9 [Candida jiufengensis]|uniref:CUP9 n=1 Tax=Candida jiufengensis TaxID=497108 RepID=UPI002224CD5E|nr:CUP9 [Candida jiufengensis]KAI5949593.1 CUP9 [Candida jiufengensis]